MSKLKPCYTLYEVGYLIGECKTLEELNVLYYVLVCDKERYAYFAYAELEHCLLAKIKLTPPA